MKTAPCKTCQKVRRHLPSPIARRLEELERRQIERNLRKLEDAKRQA